MLKAALELVKGLFSGSPVPHTRLSAEVALRVARARAASEGYDPALFEWVRLVEQGERRIWFVSEPGLGAILIAEVDDASGEVTIRRRPGR